MAAAEELKKMIHHEHGVNTQRKGKGKTGKPATAQQKNHQPSSDNSQNLVKVVARLLRHHARIANVTQPQLSA